MTTLGLAVPYRWHRSTDGLYVNSGAGAALVGGASPGAVDEWLISPMGFIGPTDQGLRFFWSGNKTFAAAANAEALVRPQASGTWTSVWSLLNEPTGAEFDYRERVASLTPWVGDSVQVAFRVVGTNGADFSIDDVQIGDFPPTSAPAHDLCANASPIPAGSFTLSGTTCYAANDSDPYDPAGSSCSIEPLGAGDVFYSINAQAGDTLTLELSGPSFPVAYLLSSCDTATATCLASTTTLQTAGGDTTGFQHIFASSGTYYLVVDALTGDCGAYQLICTFRGTVTGVGDDVGSAGLSLAAWPNPAQSGVRFAGRIPQRHHGSGRLQVFDAAGRVMFDREVVVSGDRFEAFWDGRSVTGGRVAAGVYLARFAIGGQTTSVRVAIAR